MAFLKKNIFWIGSFLLAAVMIGTWFYATRALQAATDSRETEITGWDNTIKGVIGFEAEEGAGVHPNTQTEEGMNQKIDKLANSVVAAWQLRYDAQRNIMKWPDAILSRDFTDEFRKYDPPETMPAEETGQRNETKTLLLLYKQQIPSQMKHICSIIQTNWIYQKQLDKEAYQSTNEKDEGDDAADSDAAADQEQENADENSEDPVFDMPSREIVEWNDLNQGLWFQKLTNFLYRDDNKFTTKIPSPSQVYMLQQDLWLLEAMFEIIRVVNAQKDSDGNIILDADGKPKMVLANDLAPVKKIDHVVFGREALGLLGEIQDTVSSGKSTGRGVRGGGRGIERRGGRRGGGAKANDSQLEYYGKPAFHGRYVNDKLEPIKSETIQKVLGETTLPADNLELVVAKRVPVRLAVQMDERHIPNFLAACANSPFAMEVWQVRINKHDPNEKIGLRGGASSQATQGRGSVGQQRSGFGLGAGGESAQGPADVKVALRKNYDVGVEFYGIVKIYNPVNAELITGKKTEISTP